MEDRALRSRYSHWAFVTQVPAVVINNGTSYGSKCNLGQTYRAMTRLRDEDLGVSALPVLSKCIIVVYWSKCTNRTAVVTTVITRVHPRSRCVMYGHCYYTNNYSLLCHHPCCHVTTCIIYPCKVCFIFYDSYNKTWYLYLPFLQNR